MTSPLTLIQTDAAPKAIGPYSQAVSAGGFLYVSGQIPLDPATGEMVAGNIQDQTRRVLDNIGAILSAAGTGLDRVVKTEVYLSDIQDFAAMNEVYGGYFTGPVKPARQAMQVARLPRDARVEISCVAYLG